MSAGTALIQGLANGNVSSAVANASAPYIASAIGKHIEHDAGKLAAHAIANVALALAKDENALSQAAGAVTAEAMGMLSQELYKKKPSRLTEEEKSTVSAFATLAGGIAGGLSGGSLSDGINAAIAGKTTVENNALGSFLSAAEANKKGTIEKYEEGTQAAIKEACSGGTPVSCELAVAAMGTVMSPWLLPEAMAISGAIGAGAVGAIDYGLTGSVDPTNVIGAYWTGALTRYTGFKSTVAINAASGAITSYIDGKNPFLYGTIGGVGGAIGYGIGNKIITPIADDILNPTWKTLRWDDIGMGISRPSTLNPIPGIIGTTGGGFAGETFNVLSDPKVPLENEKEARNDR